MIIFELIILSTPKICAKIVKNIDKLINLSIIYDMQYVPWVNYCGRFQYIAIEAI